MFYITSFNTKRNKPGFHLVRDGWNDYGFYTLFKLYYLNKDLIETELGFVKIGHKGQTEIGHKGQTGGNTVLDMAFDGVPDDYFSLGQSVNYYSEIRKLGDNVRIECLMGLNDLAYFKDKYEEVKNEAVFNTSLMRGINRKTVEKQFRRIAHGGAVLTRYEFEYQVNSKEQKTKFEFEVIPESLPPTNIHSIIGTNGVGKTTALKGIIDGYLNETLNEEFANTIFISFSVFDKNGLYETNNVGKEYYYVGVKKMFLKQKIIKN